MSEEEKVNSELDLESRKWKYRRQIAMQSMKVSAALTFVVIVAALSSDVMNARIDSISDIIVWSIGMFLSLTGAYMGLSTWKEIKTKG